MTKKRLLVLGLVSVMMLSIVACGKKETNEDTTSESNVISQENKTEEPTTESMESSEFEIPPLEPPELDEPEEKEQVVVSKDVPAVTEGTDDVGAINGIGIDAINGSIYGSSFGVAGFEFDREADVYEQYSVALKYKDDDNVMAHVFGLDKSKTYSPEMIEVEGYYGYEIDVAKANKKPVMSFKGLTWGATVDEIKAAYGEPTEYTYEKGDVVKYLTYKDGDIILQFKVYDATAYFDGGLQAVLVKNMTNLNEIHWNDPEPTEEPTEEAITEEVTE